MLWLWFVCCGTPGVRAAEPVTSQNPSVPSPSADATNHFYVRTYVVSGSPLLPTNNLVSILSAYTGPNISLHEIVEAAAALQLEYHRDGYPAVSVAFVPERIVGGVVTFNIAQTAIPEIVVAGECFLSLSNGVAIVSRPPVAALALAQKPPAASVVATNIAPSGTNAPPAIKFTVTRVTPAQMAEAITALQLKMAELDAHARDNRVHVISTNAGPRFEVERYTISGNTILPPVAVGQAITNIDGAFGTNVSFDAIQTVVTELGKAYHERGYGTVAVDVPQQKLTHATVKLQVLEGQLADIKVTGNRYFSSNNVMRSLPSLHTNMVLNVPIFNAELNRANANQDRQIYPIIGPGPEPGASE
ncbi:MAG TPA: POTRA domain-containing protein, partial [Candidatus Saccharimonadales bacterium]|nr:POTRA domain-containing protein [Candidatus Saccharimonadales bacterium]